MTTNSGKLDRREERLLQRGRSRFLYMSQIFHFQPLSLGLYASGHSFPRFLALQFPPCSLAASAGKDKESKIPVDVVQFLSCAPKTALALPSESGTVRRTAQEYQGLGFPPSIDRAMQMPWCASLDWAFDIACEAGLLLGAPDSAPGWCCNAPRGGSAETCMRGLVGQLVLSGK